MKLKPPVRLNREPGRPSRSRLKVLMAVGTATVGFASFAVAQAGPAFADPTQVYVTVGSDTTQDVMNQYALDLGGNEIGSYNAINPVSGTAHEIITPANKAGGNCSFTRPNGSGEGLAALRKSVNQSTTATQLAAPPQANCIDFSRSSSGPGANQAADGALVYIPFALDAVAGSTGPVTGGVVGGVTTVATNITTADSFTLADLVNLYKNCTNITEGGITYNPNTAGAGQQQIDLYVPQAGSGTRNFWATTLGFSNTTLPACVHDTIVAGADATQPVEEHDGTAVGTDANGFGPFSVAQWISQRNGHNDRRHGALVHNLGGTSPFSNGNPATGTLNTAFPITREVFNVVPFAKVSGSTADPALVSLLVGTTSALCQDAFTITGYGFARLSSTTPDLCGSIANTLRAFGAGNPV